PVVHVGEVLDEHHPESLEGEIAADDVEGQGAPRVSDVREVVDGDPAHVHARLARDEGDEVLLAAGEGVEDPERHHGTSTLTTAMAAMPSPRPRRPRCSGLLALTLTCSGATPMVLASRSATSGWRSNPRPVRDAVMGASRGASARS